METRQSRNKKNKKNKKKKSVAKKVLLGFLLVILFLVAAAGGYAYVKLDSIKTAKIDKTDIGVSKELEDKLKSQNAEDDFINIALLGIDKRDKNDVGRSDSIMIATIDKKHKKIKLTSIMRDTYVDIKGHGKDKITHAYAFGGPQLAIRTLNENFNLNIKNFVSIDFYNMENLIDSLGGVTINVKKEELQAVNGMMTELAGIGHYTPPFIKNPGTQTLNGKQALAYSRTRYVGNGDFERTERQRTVMNAIFNKIHDAGPSKYPYYVSKLLPFVTTSLSKTDILGYGTYMTTAGISTIEQERFPIDGYCDQSTINGVWYLVADMKETTNQIYNYIFEDKKPVPKQPKF